MTEVESHTYERRPLGQWRSRCCCRNGHSAADDVMLVLLMMLIVTIPIQTHAVKLDLPAGNPPPTNPPPMVVAVDMNFAVTIF